MGRLKMAPGIGFRMPFSSNGVRTWNAVSITREPAVEGASAVRNHTFRSAVVPFATKEGIISELGVVSTVYSSARIRGGVAFAH
jgi:hypothetical protein